MANLTISVDDELLQAARVKAVQQGTSVNEVCRQAIEVFARHDESARERTQALLAVLEQARTEWARSTRPNKKGIAGPAPSGREAFYDEVLAERRLAHRSR